jgi:ubiquinone/menaquinone biosynthesis C-methylase UbiE
LKHISSDSKNLLDVGCGKGYLLKKIKSVHPNLELHGFDIKNFGLSNDYHFTNGNIESLPFPDKSFDVVTCCHTLEHIINLPVAINELKRITRKQLFIVVPCQRYFYYTLDEHVNFFPHMEKLTSVIELEKFECKKVWGDWVYMGDLTLTKS